MKLVSASIFSYSVQKRIETQRDGAGWVNLYPAVGWATHLTMTYRIAHLRKVGVWSAM